MLLSPIATPLALTMFTLYFDETGNNQNAIWSFQLSSWFGCDGSQ